MTQSVVILTYTEPGNFRPSSRLNICRAARRQSPIANLAVLYCNSTSSNYNSDCFANIVVYFWRRAREGRLITPLTHMIVDEAREVSRNFRAAAARIARTQLSMILRVSPSPHCPQLFHRPLVSSDENVPERRLEILRSVSPLFRPALSSPIDLPSFSVSVSFSPFFNSWRRTSGRFLSWPIKRLFKCYTRTNASPARREVQNTMILKNTIPISEWHCHLECRYFTRGKDLRSTIIFA